MKTKEATTIDNFDIKVHERYAQDQKIYDKRFSAESSLLSPHVEISGTSTIYASQWEELFEMRVNNTPWAHFSPPPRYHQQSRRFFSYRILPTIFVDNEEEEREEEDETAKTLLKKALKAKKGKKQDALVFEKDKSTIVQLLHTVQHLNNLLGQIHSRKLQYHKG